MDEETGAEKRLLSVMGFLRKRRPEILARFDLPPFSQWAIINTWNAQKIRAYAEVLEAAAYLVNAGTELSLAEMRYDNRHKLGEIMKDEIEYQRLVGKSRIELHPLMHQQEQEKLIAQHATYKLQHEATQSIINEELMERRTMADKKRLQQVAIFNQQWELEKKTFVEILGWGPETQQYKDMDNSHRKRIQKLYDDGDDGI